MTSSLSAPELQGIQFTARERQHYRRPKTARLIIDLSRPWLQAILGCALFISYPSIWSWLLAIFIIAGAQHGLSLIAHEASHFLLCPQDKRRNDLIGTYLFAAPTLLPFNVYRQRHIIHHRLVSQLGDTKMSISGIGAVGVFLQRFSAVFPGWNTSSRCVTFFRQERAASMNGLSRICGMTRYQYCW
ncbi:MAG: fatty acid desaturase [Haliea sp.]|nr:fatty acid desaturase [Haliea sp.]